MFQRISVRIAIVVSAFAIIMITTVFFFTIYKMGNSISEIQTRGKESSIIGAKSVGTIIENAISFKILTKIDFFDSQFVPLKNTEPQEYETKFDRFLNGALSPIFHEYLQNKDVVYARAVDLNGYVPVKTIIDKKLQNPVIDASGKQILLDDRTNKASLDDKKGLVQIYSDDNDITITEFSAPIYVQGMRWGTFFVGYKNYPAANLSTFFTPLLLIEYIIFLIVAILVIFLSVNYFLTPIAQLSKMTSSAADGNIDEEISVAGNSDLSDLGRTINRLRISMKVAIERLSIN
ncbi:putative HAMP linker domain containing methyl-accepting chemotaxis protein [Desulfosarcina variabilis str. Montpellier]